MNYNFIAKRISGAKGPVPLPYKEINGLVSSIALKEHYKIYESYYETLKRTEESVPNISSPNTSAADSPFRALKLAESYAASGVLLHEMYFLNLTPIESEINVNSRFHHAILNQWGSFEQFLDELQGTAVAAKGWAVLAVCEIDPSYLKIFLLDDHNVGSSFGFSPLIAIDTVQHAYWMDWGFNVQSYVNKAIQHLNWEVISNRYDLISNRYDQNMNNV